jgi:hypothetical protein
VYQSKCVGLQSASIYNAIEKDMSYQWMNEETPLSHEKVAAHSMPGSWQKGRQGGNAFDKQVTPDTPTTTGSGSGRSHGSPGSGFSSSASNKSQASRRSSRSEQGDVLEVPGSQPMSQQDQEADLENSSTMMLCNLPCRLEDRDVVAAIKSVGYAGKYEFVYVPQRRRNNKRSGNMGYAFVHFSDPETARAFADAFQNFKFQRTTSTKSCVVKPAHIQGFDGRYAKPDGEARIMDRRVA